MADYIRSNILCQAYVHVHVAQDYESAIVRIEQGALPLVKARTAFFLYEDAEVKFDSSEGSVRSRITIFGTLILALQGVANYADFREGIILLSEDVERVAQVAVTETLFALREKGANVERIEIRTGVVGSLRRIIRQIDAINESKDVPFDQQVERLDRLSVDIGKLLDNLHDEHDVRLVEKELLELLNSLPKSPKPSPRRELTNWMINDYRKRLRELLAALPTGAKARVAAIRANKRVRTS